MGLILDQERFNSTPKLPPLYSFPTNKFCETPGLATPPVNIAGSIPFSWEEVPGKAKKPSKSRQNNLQLPPRLLFSKEDYNKSDTNDFSPTTVLDGPYGLALNRSLSLPRFSVVKKVKEKSLLFGSSRWGSLGKCNKEISEGKFDFLLPLEFDDGGCHCRRKFSGGDGGGKMKINWGIKRKGSIFDISRAKSDFWGRVYEGFKQVIVIPWKRRKQQNLRRG